MISARLIGCGAGALALLAATLAPIRAAESPTPTLLGFGCDGANAPAPAGIRGVGGLTDEGLEQAVQASTRLALGRIVPKNRHNAPFALGQDLAKGFGKKPEELPILVADCALRVGIPLVRDGKLAGRLRVGLCDRTTEFTDAQLCSAKSALAEAARLLEVQPESRLVGVPPQVEQHDGMTVDYFPIILRGRGLVMFYTAIATAPGSRYAVVVQVDGDKPCSDVQPALGCAGLATELTRVATELGKKYLLAAGS